MAKNKEKELLEFADYLELMANAHNKDVEPVPWYMLEVYADKIRNILKSE